MAKHRLTAIFALSLSLLAAAAQAAEPESARVTVRGDQPGPKIDANVYGHFVEHLGRGVYEGIWVGPDSAIPNTRGIRNDVVAALKTLQVPVVRWPGGCFADDYHWRDGVGPKEARGEGVNASWGNVREPNTFGTHEFMDFLEQIGAEPYISVNVGSAGPREAQEWMQYMTAPAETRPGAERAANGHEKPWAVPFVGVGNEAWGCGGNMRVEYYVDQFRLFSSYLKTYSGPRVQLIAAGADTDDYGWTEGVMKGAMVWRERTTPLLYDPKRPLLAGISLHYYTLPTSDWARKGPSTGFGEDQWMTTMQRVLFTDQLIAGHSAIMDKYDPRKQVMLVVDEWGAWYDEPVRPPSQLYQQNTMRDAMIAAVTLNIFHKHADRVRMANLAQMVNVLQSVILTDKDKKMILTPTYHVMEMYKVHQNATSLPITVEAPAYSFAGRSVPSISASASVDASGKTHVSLANLDPNHAVTVTVDLAGVKATGVTGRILTAPAMDSHNTFEAPDVVAPKPFTGATLAGSVLTAAMPAKSVVVLELR